MDGIITSPTREMENNKWLYVVCLMCDQLESFVNVSLFPGSTVLDNLVSSKMRRRWGQHSNNNKSGAHKTWQYASSSWHAVVNLISKIQCGMLILHATIPHYSTQYWFRTVIWKFWCGYQSRKKQFLPNNIKSIAIYRHLQMGMERSGRLERQNKVNRRLVIKDQIMQQLKGPVNTLKQSWGFFVYSRSKDIKLKNNRRSLLGSVYTFTTAWE